MSQWVGLIRDRCFLYALLMTRFRSWIWLSPGKGRPPVAWGVAAQPVRRERSEDGLRGKPQGWTDNRKLRRDDLLEPEKECPGANRTITCVRVTALIRCGETSDFNESEL